MKRFPSKLLLFGEYTVLLGGETISIPFPKYSGIWEVSEGSNLQPFFNYLKKIESIDDVLVNEAMHNRWRFNSNIPIGCGIGSSGALTAAAYDAFCSDPAQDLTTLKSILAEIESFFHGQSSGVDPLTSYLGKTIRMQGSKIAVLSNNLNLEQLHIIDSKIPRNSEPLITHFKNEIKSSPAFLIQLEKLSKANGRAINALIDNNEQQLKSSFFEISELQFRVFEKMIPDDIRVLWQKGLSSKNYAIKLCGAGGGGFFLAFGDLNTEEENWDITPIIH